MDKILRSSNAKYIKTPEILTIGATVDSKKGVYFETMMDDGEVRPSTWGDISDKQITVRKFIALAENEYKELLGSLSPEMSSQVKKLTEPELPHDLDAAVIYLAIYNSLKQEIRYKGKKSPEVKIFVDMEKHYQEVVNMFKPYEIRTVIDVKGESKKQFFYIDSSAGNIYNSPGVTDKSCMLDASDKEKAAIAIGLFILWKFSEGFKKITFDDDFMNDQKRSELFNVYDSYYLKDVAWLSEDDKFPPLGVQRYYQDLENIRSKANEICEEAAKYPIMAPLFAKLRDYVGVDRTSVKRGKSKKQEGDDVADSTSVKKQKKE